MAEKGEKRDPSSHRTPTQIRRMDRGYNARPDKIADRVQNGQARAKLEKAGRVKKGDGKDVHHKKPLRRGGTNATDNLAVVTQKYNRGWRGREKP